ncbi:vWA domain-containing protein [Jannaschia ovalis]|uniref:VWA domain-containing protein n=1 Tax=Jannaschia ovalis TaxID=3038773 RepID=A0ABY8LCT4_9RHOB|nr:VWA domain-containing protein [Jannaschia sp. GRR-S6-38]WGH79135.1 VWA domain-containing protein [Jannaschia sp. GRR-S6-38]
MRLASAALICALALPAQAQGPCATDAMLVFDGSASMSEIGFDIQDATRIEDARRAMARAMPEVELYRRIGLLTYGPGGADACTGISLRFPPIDRAAARVTAEIEALRPEGLTPLAASVEAAAELLAFRERKAIVVLVTDGNETCGGRPCALGRRLSAEAADLTIHVVGFKATRDFFAWDNPDQQEYAGDTVAKCLSDWTGGLFVPTDTVDELVEALRATLGCALIGAAPATDPRRRS